MKPRKYLTKSIFKVGLDCPRKLFYLNKPDEYINNNEEDSFLQALARGGYQVGELAKLKYPKGIEVLEKNHEDALSATSELLESESVVIFEGAFASQDSFVRSDIVIKNGNSLNIIEVKSKSFDPSKEDSEFLSSRDSKSNAPKVYAEWKSYLYDIAFQVYVARLQYPNLQISASFMGVDKSSICPESGLHQMFLVKQNGRSKEVILTKNPGPDFKGYEILKSVDLTEIIDQIIDGRETTQFLIPGNIDSKTKVISDYYLKNKAYPSKDIIGSQCKKCEFKGVHDNLKSGFDECWIEAANIEAASSKIFVFNLWNYRGTDYAFESNKYLLSDLEEDDLGDGKVAQRQLIQLEKHRNNDKSPWFDLEGLEIEMSSWIYPLHFIDFETCMPAIPFHKDMPPYSEIAFQFSHHTLDKNGNVTHKGEYINLEPGYFPSFDFVRVLKKQLETDQGTIFRYSAHENSVLNRVAFLLEQSKEYDKSELIDFIKTITTKKKDSKKKDEFLWRGCRNMIDLLELTKQYYYSPLMGGSNSLKYVLPSILAESEFLQKKYSLSQYGTGTIPSLNFKDHKWIDIKDDQISDPYKELPPIFSEEDLLKIEDLLTEEEIIRNGGAAMMAYCKAQYTQMSDQERVAIQSALLKYCELDTLAMVMLVEYWIDKVKEIK